MADTPVYPQKDLATGNTPFNQLMFVIKQALARVNVATLVQVVAVHTPGGVAPQGTVDVLPLVNQMDGGGQAVPHATIYGVPYLRIQGGTNAVICDPVAGDVGFLVVADRDITNAQASGAQANPASARRFDLADGLYLGMGVSDQAPENYVLVSPTQTVVAFGAKVLTLNASGATLAGDLQVNGKITATGDIATPGNITTTAGNVKAQGVDLLYHIHGGGTISGWTTGPVQ